jgi:hypothetical protein
MTKTFSKNRSMSERLEHKSNLYKKKTKSKEQQQEQKKELKEYNDHKSI